MSVGGNCDNVDMVRKLTPSQYQAAVRKAQQDQKRAIDNFNREVNRRNASVKRAVNDYNREVNTYNAKAREHNRKVADQRRRLDQELRRLNARPSTTTRTTYTTSVQQLVRSYESVETRFADRPTSAFEQEFINGARTEAANSVYALNALGGDGAIGEDPNEEQLRSPSLEAELGGFSPDLVARWNGALFSLSPRNPDAARHFCTSAREVVVAILDLSAPDTDVRTADPSCELTDRGVPTRRSKIRHLLHRRSVNEPVVEEFIAQDVENVLSLFRVFNDGTHGSAGRYSITELSAVRGRVEAAIGFLHGLCAF